MTRKIIIYILGFIAFTSFIIASGVKEIANWEDVIRPFFVVGFVSTALALILYNWNSIRRVTYPAVICLWVWLHKKKIINSKFSLNTYRVYKHYGCSYKKLFLIVQLAFDEYIKMRGITA